MKGTGAHFFLITGLHKSLLQRSERGLYFRVSFHARRSNGRSNGRDDAERDMFHLLCINNKTACESDTVEVCSNL